MSAVLDNAERAVGPANRLFGPRRRTAVWLIALAACLAVQFGFEPDSPMRVAPEFLTVPVQTLLNDVMPFIVDVAKPAFSLISDALSVLMGGVNWVLTQTPWILTACLFIGVAYAIAGPGLALFTAAALLYTLVTGYWIEGMNTLSLIAVSVPMSIGLGFLLGLAAFRRPAFERLLAPTLDFMQTVPAFAYLIPILILFGFGPVVGLIASMIFASPPFVRNMLLGLKRVPAPIIESALMSGATPRQLFWLVRLPSALPTLLIGVNQTTMAAFNMVIVAAVIGSYSDIGWTVLSTMRKAQFGESLVAGLVIVLMAMTLDRITWASARRMKARSRSSRERGARLGAAAKGWFATLALIAAAWTLGALPAALVAFPEPFTMSPAGALNGLLEAVIAAFPGEIQAVKDGVAFFFMMPIRLGLDDVVQPFTWGVTFNVAGQAAYIGACGALCATAFWLRLHRTAIAILFLAMLLYFGVTDLPWTGLAGLLILAAWSVGGGKVAVLAASTVAFLVVTGSWDRAMLSVYLCAAAVLTAFALGVPIGVMAARIDWVSKIVRPINDTLQTMPLFVFLIPVIMFFGIGEFSAYVAIVTYAIVPAIRYTEHGLRQMPQGPIEAAVAMGATSRQRLFAVELPIAAPEILLGLNQTIMFALAMLVIAALVGTNGLGQEIYVALSQADFGRGVVAGIGMALLGLTADRIIQAWSRMRRPEAQSTAR